MGVDDLLELLGDVMHYVMIEERLVEYKRMKWEDAKRKKLEYYIANVNHEHHGIKMYEFATCKVHCNEGMVEDGYHLLFTCSTYNAIHSRYDDILRESDNLSVILKTPPRRLSSYVYALFMHRDFVL